jgi:gag-polypeptide of LTR copia-type
VTKSNLIKTKKAFVDSRLEDLIRRRLEILGHPFSEMELIIHIMHNLPEEYESTVKFIKNVLESDSAALEKVRERLRTKF